MTHRCRCGFATDDAQRFKSHQHRSRPGSDRTPEVSGLTVGELERDRRDLAASLALARPESPSRVPILARMRAIDAELARRADR